MCGRNQVENWKLLQRRFLKTWHQAGGELYVLKRGVYLKTGVTKKKGDGDHGLWAPGVCVGCGGGYGNLLLRYGGRNKRKLLEA